MIEVTSSVVIHRPAGEVFEFIADASTFPITVTRSVADTSDDSCTVRAEVRGDPSGVFRIAAPLMKQMVQRSVRTDYRRLRELLEG